VGNTEHCGREKSWQIHVKEQKTVEDMRHCGRQSIVENNRVFIINEMGIMGETREL
jgi:hypothetical protein